MFTDTIRKNAFNNRLINDSETIQLLGDASLTLKTQLRYFAWSLSAVQHFSI